jgi:hypothetical protein
MTGWQANDTAETAVGKQVELAKFPFYLCPGFLSSKLIRRTFGDSASTVTPAQMTIRVCEIYVNAGLK